ncbi:C-type lectin domain family 4 member G-like [Eleutherodactylus coqui]|uniref:C-type lectin domain family 4 member G-like n=1 Tax=Eleutherodactylus coqui TaxID=57060 RepID=UPI003462FBE7
MKNQEMKTIQDHTRRKENCYRNNVYKNEMAEASTNKDSDMDEDVYVNELKRETKLTKSGKKNETPTTKKMSTSKIKKSRIILASLILLIIMFLILIALTSLLLKYYLETVKGVSELKHNDLEMSKEVSALKNNETVLLKDGLRDLKNRTGNQHQKALEDVKTFRKDLDDIKQHFLQNIKAVNKTIETICRICPAGWAPIGLFCYYFSTDLLTWDNARDDCIRKGSGLVMLKTREEMDALKSFLEKDRYWIGLWRDKKNANWKWLDGSVMSFSNWKPGEPNNWGNSEDCAESKLGFWNDDTCTTTLKYACKKGCCC